ncbi:MAG: hypothetical protein Q7K42_02740, partial [Candidatus Diapherotrites archaeon]|nr:hypothetical protein [Candidatus Diapherotrites archaeon]
VEDFCTKPFSEKNISGAQARIAFVGIGLKNVKCQNSTVSYTCKVKVYTAMETLLDDYKDVIENIQSCEQLKADQLKGVCFGFLNNIHLTPETTQYFIDITVTDNYTKAMLESKGNELTISPTKNVLIGSLGINLPDNWFISKFDDDKKEYRFTTAKKDFELIVWPSFWPEDLNKEAYTNEVFSSITNDLNGFELLDKGTTKIAQRDTDYIKYKLIQNGRTIIVQNFLLFKARLSWIIDFSAKEENFEEKKQDMQKILKDMQIMG